MGRVRLVAMACGLTLVLAGSAEAQLNGSHTLGDFGVQSGSQPQPGFYAALFYLRYDADTIKDADGNVVRVSPGAGRRADADRHAELRERISDRGHQAHQLGVGGFAAHPAVGPSWKTRGAIVILLSRRQ